MDTPNLPNFTRTEIAAWYGLSERGLRYRCAKYGVHITNRILTKSDVRQIIEKLGDPPFLPLGVVLP